MASRVRYLPDAVFWQGSFQSNVALEVSPDGQCVGTVPATQAADAVRMPGKLLLPGWVNGHSHAFQRLIRGATEYVAQGAGRDDFWSWRELMYQAAERLSPEDVYVASRQAFVEMALAGMTSVGEFHYLHHQSDGSPYADRNELAKQVIRAARDVGLRITLLRVGYARSGYQVPENPRQRRFKDARVEDFLSATSDLRSQTKSDPLVTVGLAPHSVRAVPVSWLEEIARLNSTHPLHMHVSEQPAEIEACLREHQARPVQLLERLGLLGTPFTAVHAIHLQEDEVLALGRSKSFVCACPTTERNLGDGVIPADALVQAGAQLSLGSDSQATIDLLEECRAVEGHLRLVRQRRNVLDPGTGALDGVARTVFAMATTGGAGSLGLPVGELRPGAPADFVTVAVDHPSLVGTREALWLPSVVLGAEKGAVRDVAVAGRLIVQDGAHPLQSISGREYSGLARRLFS
jgi:formimidoylglutamate deiminase